MQYSTLTILLVDEDSGGAQILQKMLGPVADMQFKLAHVQDLKKGLLWLSKAPIDVVLLDLPAGDDSRLQSIREIHAAAPAVPVVVLAAFVAFDADMRILQSGAQDVIVKAEMTAATLIRAIRFALARSAFRRSAPTPSLNVGAPPAPTSPPAATQVVVAAQAPSPSGVPEPTAAAESGEEAVEEAVADPLLSAAENLPAEIPPPVVDPTPAEPDGRLSTPTAIPPAGPDQTPATPEDSAPKPEDSVPADASAQESESVTATASQADSASSQPVT